jgi:hypothetical protein
MEEGRDMGTATRLSAGRLAGMLVLWLMADLIPSELFGAEVADISHGTSAGVADVVLPVHEGVLSLQAQEASLKAIFETIGRQLSIDVVTRIPPDERITIAFEQLAFAEALKRFRPYVNYLTLEDAAKAPGTIRTLIVVSKRAAGGPARPTIQDAEALPPFEPRPSPAPTPAAPDRSKPFRFEFDPTAVGEKVPVRGKRRQRLAPSPQPSPWPGEGGANAWLPVKNLPL